MNIHIFVSLCKKFNLYIYRFNSIKSYVSNQKGHSSPNVYNPNENLSNNSFGEVQSTATNFKSSKLFNCPYCGKHFLNNSYMQQHIRIHTGERPFQCNICHATFTQKGNLKVHIRVHTGDKPFKCSLCDYSTIESSNLKRHMKRHLHETT